MATVDEISSKLSALINNLSPQARRQLTRNIGVALRKRKAMFIKLKTARFLKVRSNANEVTVGFTGSGAAIANIHQYGLTGTVNKKRGIKVQYAQRELLGISEQDLSILNELVIEQISKS